MIYIFKVLSQNFIWKKKNQSKQWWVNTKVEKNRDCLWELEKKRGKRMFIFSFHFVFICFLMYSRDMHSIGIQTTNIRLKKIHVDERKSQHKFIFWINSETIDYHMMLNSVTIFSYHYILVLFCIVESSLGTHGDQKAAVQWRKCSSCS